MEKRETVRLEDLVIDPELTRMRHIDIVVVSRYRQAYRSGADFPPPIIEAGTRRIVSGNHRVTAMLSEYGPDHEVEVVVREYETELELLTDFARENIEHGKQLDGISRTSISQALLERGATAEEVANLFNVSVRKVEQWGGMSVLVIGGKSKTGVPMPIKRGPDIAGEMITREQYDLHMKCDRGVPAYSQADQLARWLRDGWIKPTDLRTVSSLKALRAALDEFLGASEIVEAV